MGLIRYEGFSVRVQSLVIVTINPLSLRYGQIYWNNSYFVKSHILFITVKKDLNYPLEYNIHNYKVNKHI